ncbi:cell wall integrity and stress response component 4-like isoform X1 [Mizuhopecten yessoensis]|nr:cell wall integrity and stress response component 4-like isoform X1 [Mizuhopecten yessoensis]
MDSRQDRLNVLGYTYTLVIVYAYITGVNTAACTDQTDLDRFFHVSRMCKSGTLKNKRVVIDTWGTGGPGIYRCTCTVTLDTGSASPTTTTTVEMEEYPRVAPLQNCGSILRINSTKSSIFTETGCTPIPNTPTNNFGTSDMLTLTLSRADVSTSWISGHCIFISSQGSTNLDLIVTCNEPITPITPTTTEEYVPTTTVEPLTTTTTTQPRETTTTTQSREITTYNSTYTGQTEPVREKCVQISHPQQGYPISAVVVPLLVTLLIIVVSTTANVVIYRRRLALLKQPKYTEAVMTSPNPVHYDSLDLPRVEPPNLYADTSTGQMYVNTAME